MKTTIDIDEHLWARFKSAVAIDRKTIKSAILELVEYYIHEVNSRRD